MDIEVGGDAKAAVVGVAGRVDAYTAVELERRIESVLAPVRDLVLDLSETSYISSAGLRVLITLAKRAQGGGFRLRLCGLQPEVRDVMDIAGFTQLFDLSDSRAEALESLRAG